MGRHAGWLAAAAGLAGASAARAGALASSAVPFTAASRARIVAADEKELTGTRALLNLGHTFGHALESATGYSDRLLHGEGVAIGCTLAFQLSARMGLCPQEDPSRVAAHFAAMGLPSRPCDIPGDLPDAEALIALMGQDKKVVDGKLRMILARGIGQAFVTDRVDRAELRAVLERHGAQATFFVLEAHCRAFPAEVQALRDAGIEVTAPPHGAVAEVPAERRERIEG
mgnify:CR=1 FL=1